MRDDGPGSKSLNGPHSTARTCWTSCFRSQVRSDSCSSVSSTSVAFAESSGDTR